MYPAEDMAEVCRHCPATDLYATHMITPRYPAGASVSSIGAGDR
jgi:hypothetical protein